MSAVPRVPVKFDGPSELFDRRSVKFDGRRQFGLLFEQFLSFADLEPRRVDTRPTCEPVACLAAVESRAVQQPLAILIGPESTGGHDTSQHGDRDESCDGGKGLGS